MNRESQGSLLSTVFIDYDNIYLSLKRKSDEAAKRFAKNAGGWLQAIASGALVTPTNGPDLGLPRRIVMNRCYGNSFPRRNAQDDATDMNSFPFVRHHFVRAGCEVIDCPPLTKQLKNSADIRMVMDVRDYLLHDTYFDEFVILSGDADFTPVLHRLRQHARRTVVYANDYTVAPYRAISDGEIREADLIKLLLEGTPASQVEGKTASTAPKGLPSPASLATARSEILNEVLQTVQRAQQPVPLEALADRAVRVLGHDKTVGLAWGGAGSFRDLLANGLPSEVRLSDAAPYFVYDTTRQAAPQPLRAEIKDTPRPLPTPDVVREAQASLERSDLSGSSWNSGIATEPGPLTGTDRPAALTERAPEQQQLPSAAAQSPQTDAYQHASAQPLNPLPQGHTQQAATAQPEQSLPTPSVYEPARAAQPALQPQRQNEPARHEQSAPNAGIGQQRVEPTFTQPAPSPAVEPVAPVSPASGQPLAQVHAANGYNDGGTSHGHIASGHPQAGRAIEAPQTPVTAAPSEPRQDAAARDGNIGVPEAQPAPPQQASPQRDASSTSSLQAAIARIHEACQAPPLSPPEYRVLFQVMAEEINTSGLTGSATLINIAQRAQDHGVEVRRDDVRFVLEVVSEVDPWFEQGASAALFASRFRNFVVARCRSQGLQLSADELDLIEAWFSSGAPRNGGTAANRRAAGQQTASQPASAQHQHQPAPQMSTAAGAPEAGPANGQEGQGAWFGSAASGVRANAPDAQSDNDFPRILQKRARG